MHKCVSYIHMSSGQYLLHNADRGTHSKHIAQSSVHHSLLKILLLLLLFYALLHIGEDFNSTIFSRNNI